MAQDESSPAEIEAFVERMGEYFAQIGSTRIACTTKRIVVNHNIMYLFRCIPLTKWCIGKVI